MLVNFTNKPWSICVYQSAKNIALCHQRTFYGFNGCGMGPLLVLVSPCFRENVVVTCKIGSFLCSLDNILQKNIIVFWKSNFKMVLIWKGLFLTYFSHFLVTMEKLQKILQHISHSPMYMYFAHPIDLFALPSLKKYEFIRYCFSLVWFLVLSLIRAILVELINNKMVSKIWKKKLDCLLLICIYTNAKFIGICKPRT